MIVMYLVLSTQEILALSFKNPIRLQIFISNELTQGTLFLFVLCEKIIERKSLNLFFWFVKNYTNKPGGKGVLC